MAWSFTWCSNLNCIVYLLQKCIVRLIAKADYLANFAPSFCHLRLFDIFSINCLSIGIFMYSYRHNLFQLLFNVFFCTAGGQFHHTILELPFSIDQIVVELMLKNSVSFIRDLKSEILYQSQQSALLLYLFKENNLKNYPIERQFPS